MDLRTHPTISLLQEHQFREPQMEVRTILGLDKLVHQNNKPISI